MKIRDWEELVDTDLPEQSPITQEAVEEAILESSRFCGSERISTGRFWTDSKFEAYRRKVLATPLP